MCKVIHTKDFGKYKNSVMIDRSTKFGNPFIIGKHGNREEVIEKYKNYLHSNAEYANMVYKELKDKNLSCWCKPDKCHGDVILEYINDRKVNEELSSFYDEETLIDISDLYDGMFD